MTEPASAHRSTTEDGSYFEDFAVGAKWRHFRGCTIGEAESQLITKLVMNTAQEHFNDDSMRDSEWGASRIVFGLVTGSLTLGLASQDVAENAIAELGLDAVRFTASMYLGDTVYAYTEVLETRDADREDAGIVVFQHWGVKPDARIVFECRRTVLIKRRSYWRSAP